MNNIEINKDNDGKKMIENIMIEKSKKWKWSIEIKFNFMEEINYINLFMILKSYSWNNILPCYSIAFGKKDMESNLMIFEKENILKVKKISYSNFEGWMNWRISSDSKYETKTDFYYILLNFEKNIINEKNIDLNNFLPLYPWKKEWMDFLKIDENRIEYLENRLKNAEKKIVELEEKLKK